MEKMNVKNLLDVLPEEAQEIYRRAYKSAHKQFELKENRPNPNENLEEVCCRVAWHAVNMAYEKDELGKWVPRKS